MGITTSRMQRSSKEYKNRYSSAKHVRWPYEKEYKDFAEKNTKGNTSRRN
jgi:hypothetical protein